MKMLVRKRMKAVTMFLVFVFLFSTVPVTIVTASGFDPGRHTHPNTHVNTGDQRYDMVAIALTQDRYERPTGQANKFTHFFTNNNTNRPWCADFISWVARQAEVSTDVIRSSASAAPSSFGLVEGVTYFRVGDIEISDLRPGDLVFYIWPGSGARHASHVSIITHVYPAGGNNVLRVISGNTNNSNSRGRVRERTLVRSGGSSGWNRFSEVVGFGIPNYATTSARPGQELTTPVTTLDNIVFLVAPRNNRAQAPINPHPYSAAETGQQLNRDERIFVTGRTNNIHGNRWYRFTHNGQQRWIYSGNVERATPIPRQELTTPVTPMNPTEFRVAPRDNAAQARINPHPYAAAHTGLYLNRDARITVHGRTYNDHGNRWYRFTHNGQMHWIYNGNIENATARTITVQTDRTTAANGQTINFTATTNFTATRVTLFFDGTAREYTMTRGSGGTTWTLSHNNLRNGNRTATVHAYDGSTRVATGRVNFTITQNAPTPPPHPPTPTPSPTPPPPPTPSPAPTPPPSNPQATFSNMQTFWENNRFHIRFSITASGNVTYAGFAFSSEIGTASFDQPVTIRDSSATIGFSLSREEAMELWTPQSSYVWIPFAYVNGQEIVGPMQSFVFSAP